MFLYKNLIFFDIFYSFNPNHAYWNQRRLFSGNLPGMFLIFRRFLFFCEFNDHYWPTKHLCLADGLHDITQDKKWFWTFFFHCEIWKLFFQNTHFSFLLYDLVSDKAGKLEVAESNLIMENVPFDFSLIETGWRGSTQWALSSLEPFS